MMGSGQHVFLKLVERLVSHLKTSTPTNCGTLVGRPYGTELLLLWTCFDALSPSAFFWGVSVPTSSGVVTFGLHDLHTLAAALVHQSLLASKHGTFWHACIKERLRPLTLKLRLFIPAQLMSIFGAQHGSKLSHLRYNVI